MLQARVRFPVIASYCRRLYYLFDLIFIDTGVLFPFWLGFSQVVSRDVIVAATFCSSSLAYREHTNSEVPMRTFFSFR
jgi:hypothetical protein